MLNLEEKLSKNNEIRIRQGYYRKNIDILIYRHFRVIVDDSFENTDIY